ncbi:MAG: nuclear transport factor 2 family protein [Gallionella sp.]|jgi:ketosteroid isomerase-like protein|nr:nuclear transport factor 2 family protein [Gallionella sp.]
MTNEQAITDITSDFYAALNILFIGDAQPMKNVWSHADDISYMGPDGLYLIGWGKIEAMWNEVAAMKLGGRVLPKQLHTVIGGDLALITCVESGENVVDGEAEEVGIRSSTVFRNEGGAWKVIAHQTDLLRYM